MEVWEPQLCESLSGFVVVNLIQYSAEIQDDVIEFTPVNGEECRRWHST